MLGYAVGCQITLTLTNVISFRNLDDRDGVFWYVRLVGTFGWIVAGFVVGWGLNPISPQPLYLAAATSAVLAVFALCAAAHPAEGVRPPGARGDRAAGDQDVPRPLVRGVRAACCSSAT